MVGACLSISHADSLPRLVHGEWTMPRAQLALAIRLQAITRIDGLLGLAGMMTWHECDDLWRKFPQIPCVKRTRKAPKNRHFINNTMILNKRNDKFTKNCVPLNQPTWLFKQHEGFSSWNRTKADKDEDSTDVVPSGKHTKNYGKSPCGIGKSTLSMRHLQYVGHYQRVNTLVTWDHQKQDFSQVKSLAETANISLEGWSRGDFFQRSKPPFRAGISRWKKTIPTQEFQITMDIKYIKKR